MPAVLDPKPAPVPSKFDDAVRSTLDETGRKIRINDALTGGLVVAAIALTYAVAMMLLDRWLELPGWFRQVSLLGFLGLAGYAGWKLVARPLRRQVNPRYVARQVEGTISDAKNAVINWVDLHDRDIPGSVRSALSQKAASELAESDPTDAVASTRMAWAGGVVALLVGVLAVLFLVFKSQFLSLLGRTFNPFSTQAIVSRTTIELVEPTGDRTITDGTQIGFVVRVTGNIPPADSPKRVRLQIRYSQDSTEYEEYPMDRGDTIRDYSFTATRTHIQNGFWYRVAAGDAETPEYRVTVRARPMIQEFESRYEYPEYLRLKPDISREARIDGFRGTNVTLTVKTNRTVKSGTLTTEIGNQETPLEGEVVGENRDSLRFKLTLQDQGTYSINFTSTEGEVSGPSIAFPLIVYVDQPPTIAILKPEQPEIVLPTNGLLAVDAIIGDDQGIASAVLKFKLTGGPSIAPKPYRDGKTFQRDTDKSFPTSLDYKDSVKLDSLKGSDGKPVKLTPDTVLEYWIEATDNCTVPAANVGKSPVYRVRLTKPEMDPMKQPEQQKQQQQQAEKRQNEEQQNNQQQDQKNKTEKRDPKQPENRDKEQQDPKPGEQGGQQEQPKPGEQGMGDPKPNDPNMPPPKPDPNQPNQNPMEGNQGGAKDPNAPKPEDQKTQQQADELQKRIDEEQKQPSQGKGDPNETKPDQPQQQPAQGKPGDKNQPKPPEASEPKAEPKPDMNDPNGGGSGENKGAGEVQQPKKSEEKPAPKPGEDPNGTGKPEQQPNPNETPNGGKPNEGEKAGPKPDDPQGAGQSKSSQPQPGQAEPPPQQPNQPPRDNDPSGGKGSGEPKQEQSNDPMQPQQQPKPGENTGKPDAGKAKPSGDVNRGEPKPQPGQKGDGTPEPKPGEKEKPDPNQQPARGREQQPPKPGEGKPQPKEGQPMGGDKPEAAQPKEGPKEGGNEAPKGENQPGETKGEGTTPESKAAPKGEQKPSKPDEQTGKPGEQSGKPSEGDKAKQKEVEDALKDLGSNDKAKQDAAREKLDKTIGPDARKKAEEIANDMKSGDPKRQEAAKQKLEEMAKQAGQQGQPDNNNQQRNLSPEEKEKLKEAAKDLNNPDPAKRQAAEKKVDDMIGKNQREKLQDQVKEFEKNVEDLGSDDKAKREAAKKNLDKTVGEDVRKKAEQVAADKKSADEKRREEAKQKEADLAKEQAGQKARDPDAKPRELTEKEKQELADAAKDLTSKDEGKRKEAEKKLDEQIGKKEREELQKDLQDLQGNDPDKAKAALEKLEQKAKEAQEREDREWKLGGTPPKGPEGKPLQDNPENRLKAAELQLKNFKEYKDNPEFLKKANMTQKEMDEFIKGYEEMVKRQKAEVEQAKAAGPRQPGVEPKRNVSDATGANTRLTGPQTVPGGPSIGGPALAPPGFSDAHKRFVEEALKGNK